MEVGSIADWLSAVGGLLAVVAAVIAWWVSVKALKLEQQREAAAQAARRREQAELVYVMGATLSGHDKNERWAVFIANGSSKPIYDVEVRTQHVRNGSAQPVLHLGAVPPGHYVVPRHPQYNWGHMIDYERLNVGVDLLVRGKGNAMVTEVNFRDARRIAWCLVGGTELWEVDGAGIG
ncbi:MULTISPECIES: hypothetical protein [unclassified Actinobaculum]|uniref:hypothetical protein n=1 Tax=unclassified Actinobaculum TaxID=2609299 RepID=UPI000D526F88|nr:MULTISPECIES: hypothetical protein [unclassified Actinobaculum]AWE41869.1 hypothetical protein DDD63_02840 [Actinobaculum sp. 313]RTE50212.1 hypothetical protein EKN07_03090 [Actinobaculum sp. 352]